MMRNPCKDCIYYHKKNKTCQSKKCATGGSGKISWIDKLFCSSCKKDGQSVIPCRFLKEKREEIDNKNGSAVFEK